MGDLCWQSNLVGKCSSRDDFQPSLYDPRILAAAKTEASSYPTFADGEDEAFETVLDAALFKEPSSAESFVRSYMEQQLVLQPGLFEQTNDIKELRSEAGPR